MDTNTALTPATLARFIEYAQDADNWGGMPLVGGNVGGDAADNGYLTAMKKQGLIKTQSDDRGDIFLAFTAVGVAFAAEHGVALNE